MERNVWFTAPIVLSLLLVSLPSLVVEPVRMPGWSPILFAAQCPLPTFLASTCNSGVTGQVD
jgi:hypothetical protein